MPNTFPLPFNPHFASKQQTPQTPPTPYDPMKELKGAWDFANEPLLPQGAIQPMQDRLEQPHLDQSPMMARVKGFGSGALSGLRNLTSPINLASIAGTFMGGGAAPKLAGEAIEGGEGAMSALKGLNPRTYTGPISETLGEVNPMFTPQGGEGMFNASKVAQGIGDTAVDPLVEAFKQKWAPLLTRKP